MTIDDQKRISELQAEFNSVFPYLKIEFYIQVPKSQGKKPVARTKTFGEYRKSSTAGILSITPNVIVSDLDQAFKNSYGLNIRVLRKSGKVWLETTATDAWSLEQQNRQGEELSNTRY